MTREGADIEERVESLTAEIVEHVALLEGTDPLELQPPLQSVIDLDAVEAIIEPTDDRPRSGRVTLAFDYRNYQVLIERDDGDTAVRVSQSRPR